MKRRNQSNMDSEIAKQIIEKLKEDRFNLEKEIQQLIGKIKVTDPEFKFTIVLYEKS